MPLIEVLSTTYNEEPEKEGEGEESIPEEKVYSNLEVYLQTPLPKLFISYHQVEDEELKDNYQRVLEKVFSYKSKEVTRSTVLTLTLILLPTLSHPYYQVKPLVEEAQSLLYQLFDIYPKEIELKFNYLMELKLDRFQLDYRYFWLSTLYCDYTINKNSSTPLPVWKLLSLYNFDNLKVKFQLVNTVSKYLNTNLHYTEAFQVIYQILNENLLFYDFNLNQPHLKLTLQAMETLFRKQDLGRERIREVVLEKLIPFGLEQSVDKLEKSLLLVEYINRLLTLYFERFPVGLTFNSILFAYLHLLLKVYLHPNNRLYEEFYNLVLDGLLQLFNANIGIDITKYGNRIVASLVLFLKWVAQFDSKNAFDDQVQLLLNRFDQLTAKGQAKVELSKLSGLEETVVKDLLEKIS